MSSMDWCFDVVTEGMKRVFRSADSVICSSLDMSGLMETPGVSASFLRFARMPVTSQEQDSLTRIGPQFLFVFTLAYAITNQVGRYRWVEFLYYCCYVLHVFGYTSMSCGALWAFTYPIDYDVELFVGVVAGKFAGICARWSLSRAR